MKLGHQDKKINPQQKNLEDEKTAEQHDEEAQKFYAQGKLDEALQECDKALKKFELDNKWRIHTRERMGRIFLQMGRECISLQKEVYYENALQCFEDIIKWDIEFKKDPRLNKVPVAAPSYYNDLANTLYCMHCYDEAFIYFNKAMAIATPNQKKEMEHDAKRIAGHLTPEDGAKKAKDEKETLIRKTRDAIFLALFADFAPLPADEKNDAKCDQNQFAATKIILQIIQQAFLSLPAGEMSGLVIKLKKEPGDRFYTFAKFSLFQDRVGDRRELKQIDALDHRKKWYGELGKDLKQNDVFKTQLKRLVGGYVKSNHTDIILRNIANEIIVGIGLNGKINPEVLIDCIRNVLGNSKIFTVNFEEKKDVDFFKILREEIFIAINGSDKSVDYYKLRIFIGAWKWLEKNYQLSKEEKSLYELAKNITQQSNMRHGNKDSKIYEIQLFLVLQALLEYSPRELILSLKSADFIEYVAKTKFVAESKVEHGSLADNPNKRHAFKKHMSLMIGNAMVPSVLPDNKMIPNGLGTLSPNQKFFVDFFNEEFNKFYCMYKALGWEKVRRLAEAVDRVADAAKDYEDVKAKFPGFELPLGLGFSFFAQFLVNRKDKNVVEAAKRVDLLFSGDMEENAILVRAVAEHIARQHHLQIDGLQKGPDIVLAAHNAVHRAIQYVVDSDDNLVKSKDSLFRCVCNSFVAFINGSNKYKPQRLPNYNDPINVLLAGVMEGLAKDDKKIVGLNHKRVAVGGLYKNAGLVVREEGGYRLYVHKDLLENAENFEGGSLIYGYRWASIAELEVAKKSGYVADDKTPLENVRGLPKPPNPPASLPAVAVMPPALPAAPVPQHKM